MIKEFKPCIHSDIKKYIDIHSVSSLVEASNMTGDYPLTLALMFAFSITMDMGGSLKASHDIEPCSVL
jgi:hypothetical protein